MSRTVFGACAKANGWADVTSLAAGESWTLLCCSGGSINDAEDYTLPEEKRAAIAGPVESRGGMRAYRAADRSSAQSVDGGVVDLDCLCISRRPTTICQPRKHLTAGRTMRLAAARRENIAVCGAIGEHSSGEDDALKTGTPSDWPRHHQPAADGELVTWRDSPCLMRTQRSSLEPSRDTAIGPPVRGLAERRQNPHDTAYQRRGEQREHKCIWHAPAGAIRDGPADSDEKSPLG